MVYVESLAHVCLDTDVLIDFLRKPSGAVKRMMEGFWERKASLYTTSVNTFEIWLGAHLAPEKMDIIEETEDFLNQFEVITFGHEASAEAGRVMADLKRRGRIIEIRDLFVGCICKVADVPLITRNSKHYGRIHGLKILTPEQALRKLHCR